ncbi:ATP-dependent DNA helicase II subunit 1 [Tulasnella sp. JGI-2019a]|nr:ATP-dependent DNA helicase II subunit 1 [Tulasnella sp. JGI-2019a]
MASLKDDWDLTADDDEELEETMYESTKETILFCIDASKSMQAPQPGNKNEVQRSNLLMALECAADLQKRLVLFNPGTSVGVVLYNTDERYDGEGGETSVKDHHQLIQTIKQINAPQIQNLLSIIAEAEEDLRSLTKRFKPVSQQIAMATVFNCCTGIFRQGAPKTSVKRVFLITDNDTPPNSAHDTSVAARTYLDLTDIGATIVPFFLSNKREPFNVAKFYSHVLVDIYESGDIETIPDPIAGFDELKEEMRIRESVKRALFSVPLHFGEGLTIGVKGYGVITETKRPNPKKFANMGQRMEDVTPVTIYVDAEQQVEVDKSKIVYGFKDSVPTGTTEGDDDEHETKPGQVSVPKRQPILFTPEQVREFKTLGSEPGISILGFKNKDTLHIQDNLKHAYFLYPDEKSWSGSTRAFNALLKATANKGKIAIARYMPRRGTIPGFAALVPQIERVASHGQQAPPGFQVVVLPFADDVRQPPLTPLKGAAEEQTDAACKIIEKLTLKGQGYLPDTYLNPALSLHYGLLQATAFSEEYDIERDFTDTTKPNYDMIHTRVGPQLTAWKDLLLEDEEANAPIATATTGTKRKADTSVDEAHIRDMYNDGKTTKLTVAQLKNFCRAKALSIAGVKADLVTRVEEWLEQHG